MTVDLKPVMSFQGPSRARVLLTSPVVQTALVVLVAVVSAVWQHWPTVGYGFHYDDYHFVRPYSLAEVIGTFHGTWDSTGIERPFYRPLTILLYSLRFEAFRYSEVDYHVASVAAFALTGILGALLVRRLSGRLTSALWFCLLWAVHPNVPLSLTAWITNQMHLAQVLVFLAAMWWWVWTKGKPFVWWLPLLVLGACAFLIKEDGILLLPCVVVAHELYRRLVDKTVPRVPIAIVVAGLVVMGSLFLMRHHFLGGLGGYTSPPSTDVAWNNLLKGPGQALFLLPARTLLNVVQSWLVALLLPAAIVLALRTLDRGTVFLVCLGLLVVFLFDLPFALVTKREQYYLLAFGAVFALSGALGSLTISTPRWGGAATVIFGAVLVVTMHGASTAVARQYAPLSPTTLQTDGIVQEWVAVPIEIRQWLKRKTDGQRVTSLSRDVAMIVNGAHAPERGRDGREYRWSSGHVLVFLNPRTSRLSLSMRALFLNPTRRDPFDVTVRVEGQTVSKLVLHRDDEQRVDIEIPARVRREARMSLVELVVSRTWTPGGTDSRELGVMLYGLDAPLPE